MNYDIKQFAYIGDSVWDLFIRNKVIKKTKVLNSMHKLSTKYVCANFQAELLLKISDFFNNEENEIIKRGRNIKISINKRNNPQIHSHATAFEAIVGYFYLNNKIRLEELFLFVEPYLDELN